MWGAISSFSSTLSTSLDSVEGGSCGVGPSSIAAIRTGGSGDGRHNSIMGSVRSRPITSDDTTSVDGTNTVTCSSPSSFQQHHSKSKSFCGNGGSYLQKNDLRYDIGAASQYHPVRQPSVRSRNQQPMPSPEELDRKFTKVLVSIFCRFLCFVWGRQTCQQLIDTNKSIIYFHHYRWWICTLFVALQVYSFIHVDKFQMRLFVFPTINICMYGTYTWVHVHFASIQIWINYILTHIYYNCRIMHICTYKCSVNVHVCMYKCSGSQ